MGSAGAAEPSKLDITLREMRGDVERVQSLVAAELTARRYDADAMFAVRLCLEEALVNAFRHGNRFEPGSWSGSARRSATTRVSSRSRTRARGSTPEACLTRPRTRISRFQAGAASC